MKITLEPETDDEKKQYSETLVFEKVFEFCLAGSLMQSQIVPQDFNHTHGDSYKIFGRLAEMQERIRKFHGA